MHTRSSTIIAAGVIASFVGIITVIAYGRSVEHRAGGGTSVSAYTVTRDIPAGTKGEDVAGAMKKTSLPKDARPSASVTDPAQLTGKIAVRAISSGEVVTSMQFGSSIAAPAAGLQIPPGFNAVSFNFPAPQGVAYYVQGGDLVNVFVTLKGNTDPKTGGAQTKMILSNVQVLANQTARAAQASGRLGGSNQTGEVVLTMALKPGDAEKLVFAKENGSVWLGLVHPGDQPASTGGQTAATVVR